MKYLSLFLAFALSFTILSCSSAEVKPEKKESKIKALYNKAKCKIMKDNDDCD